MSAFGGKAPLADRRAVTPRVSLSLARMRGPFSPLWPPLPCFEKRQGSFPAVRTDRRGKSPTSMPWAVCLATSRRPNSRLGQIPRNACRINDVGRLKFQRKSPDHHDTGAMSAFGGKADID